MTLESACIESTYTRGADTEGTYARDTCIGNTCISGACTESIYVGVNFNGIYIRAAITCVEDPCVCSAGAVKCSGIHLQSFQILEIEGAGLEI